MRLALLLEIVGPWFATRIFLPKSIGIWFIIYPIYVNILPIIGYFYEGDDAALNGVWNSVAKHAMKCAVISPMGWLKFGQGAAMFPGQVWSGMICLPGLYSLPSKTKAVVMLVFGAVSHYLTFTYTDSPGSAWCFANAFNCIFFLADYCLFESGDEVAVKVVKGEKTE